MFNVFNYFNNQFQKNCNNLLWNQNPHQKSIFQKDAENCPLEFNPNIYYIFTIMLWKLPIYSRAACMRPTTDSEIGNSIIETMGCIVLMSHQCTNMKVKLLKQSGIWNVFTLSE